MLVEKEISSYMIANLKDKGSTKWVCSDEGISGSFVDCFKYGRIDDYSDEVVGPAYYRRVV